MYYGSLFSICLTGIPYSMRGVLSIRRVTYTVTGKRVRQPKENIRKNLKKRAVMNQSGWGISKLKR